jgi:hypothetical protein
MRLLQIVPRDSRHFFSDIVEKQDDIRRNGRGTFTRKGPKRRGSARWTHAKFKGSVDLARGPSDVVTAKIKSRASGDEQKLASAFLGWIDRHFGDELVAVTINYR